MAPFVEFDCDIVRRETRIQIRRGMANVVKHYPSPHAHVARHVENVLKVLEDARVPNVVHLGYTRTGVRGVRHFEDGSVALSLEPLAKWGLQDYYGPSTAASAVHALIAVCVALHGAHAIHVVHCDIRWPNVLPMNDGSTLVIDWDDAVVLPEGADTCIVKHLRRADHAPEFEDGLVSRAADAWSVGLLIRTSQQRVTLPAAVAARGRELEHAGREARSSVADILRVLRESLVTGGGGGGEFA